MALLSRGRVVVAVGAAAVVALIALLLRPSPVAVEAAAAARGEMRVSVDEEGETRVRDRYLIAAPVSGRLQRIGLDAGDAVEEGDVVARMNPTPLDPRLRAEAQARLQAAEAAKREADARVEQAHAAAAKAAKDAERFDKLGRAGTVSAEEHERAQLEETARQKDLEAALFAARAADHQIEAARAALMAPGNTSTLSVCAEESEACLALHSPVDGRVLRVFEESERVVSVGTPLLEVGDPGALEVVIDLLSSDAVKVEPGQEVLFEDWGGGETLRGRVRLVEPSGFTKVSALGVEEQRVNVIADFVDPPGRLGDAFRLEARIIVWESPDVLKIPSSAIFRRDGRWAVFKVANGRAHVTPVDTGQRNSFEVEVRGGIGAGDLVIVHPSDLVDDGVRVRVEDGA